ncbi:MAG: fused MFS/spermidine synthase [Phycisphaeraceae bacterium]|nr:fused MFS/spermidine synthase [Phycisphaeraceae bacterium]
MPIVFAIVSACAACLLFVLQPMAGGLFLPVFGGAPAVWNTAMLFFQTVLLAGYLYAHLLTRRLSLRAQVFVHAAVLLAAFVALPVAVSESRLALAHEAHPIFALLSLLTLTVGLPFFAVSSAGPLLQRWYCQAASHGSRDPYVLYAASNAGSLVGLIAYPFSIAPSLGLDDQGVAWTIGYAVFVLLTAVCAATTARARARASKTPISNSRTTADTHPCSAPCSDIPPRCARSRRLAWIFFAFVPSSLMLGATQHITTDVAAVPLLWIAPLAIYLVTFIMAFSARSLARPIANRGPETTLWKIVAIGVGVSMLMAARGPIIVLLALHLVAVFAAGLLCHRRLAASRPHPQRLTEFYLLIATGGALGGAFNALLAPLLFNDVYEYPIAIALACLALPALARPGSGGDIAVPLPPVTSTIRSMVVPALMTAWIAAAGSLLGDRASLEAPRPFERAMLFGVPAVLAYLASRRPAAFAMSIAVLLLAGILGPTRAGNTVHKDRTFFGVHAVVVSPTRNTVTLMHGTTIHGVESRAVGSAGIPLAYYHPDGPGGQSVRTLVHDAPSIGIVGLGAGALAHYTLPDQRVDFHEIDPHVVWIAQDSGHFSFLRTTRANIRFFIGDARLTLARQPDDMYDLLVIDAFSSDAIPVHLLTREAFRVYLRTIKHDGVLVFHVSNRYLDISSVVAALAHDAGTVAVIRSDMADERTGTARMSSTWVLVARSRESFRALANDARWHPLRPTPNFPVWTDNHADLLRIIAWW